MDKKKIKIGIFLPSSKLWMGGANYYLRLISLLSEHSSDIEVIVFMTRGIDYDFSELLVSMDNVELVFLESTKQPFINLLSAIFFGKDKAVSYLAGKYSVDVFYSNAAFFGWNFKTPVLSWIPDLQHLFLPELFSSIKKLKRNIGFLMQAKFSSGIIFSSYDAKNSFIESYPVSNDKLFVIRFSVKDIEISRQEEIKVKKKYQLSEEYI
ncbi:hypothetical protein, partial [Aliivibrio kagoshimensis]|uniref:hypothetical protein n=1 Tax=Aliivibrio kagoshimensis TaxID=2910230 RepID=UPI003D095E38